jgi:uncharacterized protein YecT (DUF1311 family)
LLAALLCASAARADDLTDCPFHVRPLACPQYKASALTDKLAELRQRLDQSYQQALAKFPDRTVVDADGTVRHIAPEPKQRLVQSQAAWQGEIEKTCAYSGGVQDGTSTRAKLVELQCRVQATQSRIEFLEHLPPGS